MEIEDRIRLETPEGVALDLQLAGVGSRFSAALIDALIQGAALLAVAVLVSDVTESGWVRAGSTILAFLLLYAYDVLFETLASGRTPGKRAHGLRVVLQTGEPVTFLAALVRNLLRIVDFLPLLYATGIVAILATRRNQRLGDLAAGTIVVRERHPVQELPAGGRVGLPAVDDEARAWDVTGVPADALRVATEFLARRPALPTDVRARVAAQVAGRLRATVVGPVGDLDDETLIEHVVARKLGDG